MLLLALLVWLFWDQLLLAFQSPHTRHKETSHYTEDCIVPELEADRPELILHRKGYILSFNSDWRIANWVAYQLTRSELTGNQKREKTFRKDPNLKAYPTTSNDYRKTGFDRGHLAPAADMTWDKEAMRESFYMSNITPQHPDLNQGKWKELEEAVRRWAKQDSIVAIACGPIVTKNDSTIGKNRIIVPHRFYKVILIPFAEAPKAIGFIFENQTCSKPLSAYCVSVDSVEKVTGINFFAALPDAEEDPLEAACEPALWDWLPNQRSIPALQ